MSFASYVNFRKAALVAVLLAIASPVAAQNFDSPAWRRVTFGSTKILDSKSDCTLATGGTGSVCTDSDDGTLYTRGASTWTAVPSSGGAGTFASVTLSANGALGSPVIKWSALSTAGLYLNQIGSSGVGVNGLLFVGNGTASFLSPTRRMDVSEVRATPGATDLSTLVVTQINTPVASAHTGYDRAFSSTNAFTGTQNATESTGILGVSSDTTSGVVTTQNAMLAATGRSGGNTTTASVYRADKSVTGGTTTSGISFLANSPTVSGGGALTNSFGLYLQNQWVSGVTNGYQIHSDHDSSGAWSLYHDGSSQDIVNQVAAGTFVNGSTTARAWDYVYTGGAQSGYKFLNRFTASIQPTADTTAAYIGQWSSISNSTAHNNSLLASYYGGVATDLGTTDNWDATNGGGAISFIGDPNNYGTSTIPFMAAFTAWGGTGAGSTTTRMVGFHCSQMYEYAGAITTKICLDIDDQVTGASGITNNYLIRAQSPNGDFIQHANGVTQVAKSTFSTLPACSATYEGGMRWVTDSTTAVWGATITGSGANKVMANCNGTNWTVAGK